MSKSVRMAAMLCVVLASPIASAAGWEAIFRNTPVQDFNDEDVRLYVTAVKEALDAPVSQESRDWGNPASKAGGSLQVVGQPQIKGQAECRRVRTLVHSAKRKGQAAFFTACKQGNGRWLLVTAG